MSTLLTIIVTNAEEVRNNIFSSSSLLFMSVGQLCTPVSLSTSLAPQAQGAQAVFQSELTILRGSAASFWRNSCDRRRFWIHQRNATDKIDHVWCYDG